MRLWHFGGVKTTRTLEGHSVERMYLRHRCFDSSVNKTILKPCLAAAAGRQYVYVWFSRRKIPRSSAYTISEKAIRFRHPDYNPDRAQKLINSSMSRHLSTRNISSKSMHGFLSNLANRQTDRKTIKHGQKHVSPPLSGVIMSTVCWGFCQINTFLDFRFLQGSVATHCRWGGNLCDVTEFSYEFTSERILKIGPHLPKLYNTIKHQGWLFPVYQFP